MVVAAAAAAAEAGAAAVLLVVATTRHTSAEMTFRALMKIMRAMSAKTSCSRVNSTPPIHSFETSLFSVTTSLSMSHVNLFKSVRS